MDGNVSAYRKEATSGKSPLELVIQVYDGAVAAFRSAAEAYRQNRTDEGYEQLQRARRFVTHLYTTLDHDKGGDVSEQLGRLYAFVINQISVIEATKDLALIDDNITVLNNLREGWIGLREQQRTTDAPSTEQAPVSSGEFTHSA